MMGLCKHTQAHCNSPAQPSLTQSGLDTNTVCTQLENTQVYTHVKCVMQMYMHIQCIIIIWTSQISESSTCMSLSLSLSPSPSLGSSLSPLSLSPFLSITNSALIYVLHSCQSLSPPPPNFPLPPPFQFPHTNTPTCTCTYVHQPKYRAFHIWYAPYKWWVVQPYTYMQTQNPQYRLFQTQLCKNLESGGRKNEGSTLLYMVWIYCKYVCVCVCVCVCVLSIHTNLG